MIDIKNIIQCLPPMKSGNDLVSALECLPDYDESVSNENEAVRLIALSDLYKIYIPSPMSKEIYSKLYLALLRSLQKKGTITAVRQQNENYKAIRQHEYSGIIGGSDSFTIIGASGIGKSSAISRAIDLISANGIITVDEPYTRIIPCIVVQCPFDSSVKGLLLEILRKVDDTIGSNYYNNAMRVRATTDMLIGSVSQIALNHIGLLVVDEIQNVVNNKHGTSLVGMLTQLINNSGISICMVGTPESSMFFEQAMQLARRSLGLQYGAIDYDLYFYNFCKSVLSYSYVKEKIIVSDAMIQWLYEHSGGIVSVVISLIHDAQEIAILSGKETVNIETLNEAYQKRLALLHGYIRPDAQKTAPKRKNPSPIITQEMETESVNNLIYNIALKAKNQQLDIVDLLREKIEVVEVNI